MSKKTVVIADDHTFSAEGLKAALEATGRFTVCNIINNGIDAIATIKTVKPDFAILDYSMPDANGLEVFIDCLLYTSPSPRDRQKSRMPSSA